MIGYRLYQFHIAEPLTLVQLATETRMSSRHFIRLFRQQSGMNFPVPAA
ncbi:MAG TPA: hypothetical protein DEA91_07510 [Paenibacillus sp.]|nr:hypothetical protein [Paenibacillus sp.]